MENNIKNFLIWSVVSLLSLGGLTSVVFATHVPNHNPQTPVMVTICHAAGLAGTTQYITLTIPENAVYGQAGHFNENGTPQAGHEQDYLGPCITGTPTPTPTGVVTPTLTQVTVTPTPTIVIPTISIVIPSICPTGGASCNTGGGSPTPTATPSATATPTPTPTTGATGGTSTTTTSTSPAVQGVQAEAAKGSVLGASTMAGTGTQLPQILRAMLAIGMLSLGGGSVLYAKTKKS